jgi:hypothetical protein
MIFSEISLGVALLTIGSVVILFLVIGYTTRWKNRPFPHAPHIAATGLALMIAGATLVCWQGAHTPNIKPTNETAVAVIE